MKIFKCFLVLVGVYFVVSACMSDEEIKEWYAAQERAAAAEREYNRVLDANTIDEITTCRHGSLDTVKKNIVFMGYDIETLDKQVLITKWHQYTSYNNGAKAYDKISVIKVSPDLIKFKKRERYEYPYTEQDKQVSTLKDSSYEQRLANKRQACRNNYNSAECQKEVVRKDQTSETVSYRNTFRVNEYEPTYYARNLNSYKTFRNNVCGVEPVKNVDTESKNKQNNK